MCFAWSSLLPRRCSRSKADSRALDVRGQRPLEPHVDSVGACSIRAPAQELLRISIDELLNLSDMPDTAACLVLVFLLAPDQGLTTVAAISVRWERATHHPELWWRVCTRGETPLVKQGLKREGQDAEGATSAKAWPLLARLGCGVVRQGWAGELPPDRLLRMLQDLRADTDGGWMGLTTLSVPASGGVTMMEALPCERFFPSGFLQFTLADEENTPAHKDGGSPPGSRRFWLRITCSPLGPISLRVLLAGPALEKQPALVHKQQHVLGAHRELRCVELSAEFRGGAGARAWRLDGYDASGDTMEAIQVLRSALAVPGAGPGGLHAALRVEEPADTEGKPGGSGWIPWAPAKPKACFVVHAHP